MKRGNGEGDIEAAEELLKRGQFHHKDSFKPSFSHELGLIIIAIIAIIRRRENAARAKKMGNLPWEEHLLLRRQDCDGSTGGNLLFFILSYSFHSFPGGHLLFIKFHSFLLFIH